MVGVDQILLPRRAALRGLGTGAQRHHSLPARAGSRRGGDRRGRSAVPSLCLSLTGRQEAPLQVQSQERDQPQGGGACAAVDPAEGKRVDERGGSLSRSPSLPVSLSLCVCVRVCVCVCVCVYVRFSDSPSLYVYAGRCRGAGRAWHRSRAGDCSVARR